MPSYKDGNNVINVNLDAYSINTFGEVGVFWGEEVFNFPMSKEPIIDKFLYEGDCICISSAPKCGKSLFAKQLMCALSSGSPFLDSLEVHRRCNVLYVQTEGDRSETIERLTRMREGVEISPGRIFHMNLAGIALNTPEGFATFSALAEQPRVTYDVIIIDPLYTTVKGSMKDDNVATDWIRNVRSFKAKHSAAMIVINHDAKESFDKEGNAVDYGNARTFGSQMWLAFFNHNFRLKKFNGMHRLEIGVQRSGKIIEQLDMKLLEKPLMFTNNAMQAPSRENKVSELLKTENRWMHQPEIMKRTGNSQATISRAICKLRDNKMIEEMKIEGILHYKYRGEDGKSKTEAGNV